VAGTFYPADDRSREALVDALLAGLPPVERCAPAAVMVPHAGLRFSGRVAADVWRRLRIPRDVLIIGPKHTHHGVDWAVAPHDLWHLSETSRLRGGPDLAQQIAARVPGMQLDSEAHRHEHGIEAQLPLLYRFAPQARVAAIAMHGGTLTELRRAAAGLAEWIRSLKQPPLMVISSDMNHFADDTENRRRDRVALEALATGDAKTLLSVCQAENVTMCGRIPAAITLLTLKALGWRPNYREIAYATSADVSGDRSRVVGYAGVLL
jgi:AmmeMemoRadiSam system protein B